MAYSLIKRSSNTGSYDQQVLLKATDYNPGMLGKGQLLPPYSNNPPILSRAREAFHFCEPLDRGLLEQI